MLRTNNFRGIGFTCGGSVQQTIDVEYIIAGSIDDHSKPDQLTHSL
jgi:hypothetical protein